MDQSINIILQEITTRSIDFSMNWIQEASVYYMTFCTEQADCISWSITHTISLIRR